MGHCELLQSLTNYDNHLKRQKKTTRTWTEEYTLSTSFGPLTISSHSGHLYMANRVYPSEILKISVHF